MGRFTQYVTWEMIRVFLVTLTGVTFLMLLLGVVQEASQQVGLGFGTILQILPYLLPNALRFAVPATVLFTVCSVYGRMSSANEIVALKSLGVSPAVVVNPALVFGFLISLVAVWLNDLAVSWGQQGIQRVVVASVEEIAYGMLRAHKTYTTRQFSISVRGLVDRTLIDPVVIVTPDDDSPSLTIMAETSELHFYPDSGELSISLTNYTVEYGDDTAVYRDEGTIEKKFALLDDLRSGVSNKRPSQYSLKELARESASQRVKLEDCERFYAADACYHLLTGDVGALATANWQDRQMNLVSSQERLHRLQTEPYRRWANGFSCLGFVLVGVPLAVRFRNADLMSTFGICFLPILIAYYPLLMFAVDRAKCGAIPPYSVWLGNMVLGLTGALLWRHIVKH